MFVSMLWLNCISKSRFLFELKTTGGVMYLLLAEHIIPFKSADSRSNIQWGELPWFASFQSKETGKLTYVNSRVACNNTSKADLNYSREKFCLMLWTTLHAFVESPIQHFSWSKSKWFWSVWCNELQVKSKSTQLLDKPFCQLPSLSH